MKRTAFLLIAVLSTACWALNGDMGNGDGSQANPYLIEDLADFDTFADPNNAATYWAPGVQTQLTTDIDLAGRTYTTAVIAPDIPDITNWDFDGIPFEGNFNGNGNAIVNLDIIASINFIGLYGSIGLVGQISNLRVVNVNITGNNYVGGLVGMIGDWQYGGGDVRACYVTGQITGVWAVGGLVGINAGNIVACYSTVNVVGDWGAGGLAGESTGIITNCYSDGFITGTQVVGGLVAGGYGNVINSYSTCAINSVGNGVGGLVGIDIAPAAGPGVVTNSFWDVQTSQIGNAGDDNFGAIGKTTAEMMLESTFTDWDFSTPVWMMLREGEDYPRLAWQEVFAGDIAGLYGVDMVDFSYLGQYWGLDDCNGLDDCGRADIDTSGDVGITDLAAVTDDWLEGK